MKLWKLVPAVVLAVGSVAAIPAVVLASTGVSPACAAATSAYHQDEADLDGILSQLKTAIGTQQSLQDQVNADKGVIATYNYLESQESADKTAVEHLTSAEEILKESIPDLPPESLADFIGLAIYAAKIGAADYSLNNVENQLNALDGQFQQDNADITGLTSQLNAADANVSALENQSGEISLLAASEAVTAACQDSGSGSPAPTGSPAPSPSPAASGSGQYYDNGVTFAEGVYTGGSSQYGVPVGGSVTPQYACTTVESTLDSSGALDGTDPDDIGTTEADQAEWLSGCVAGATADLNGTQSQAPTGSPAPAGSSATTPMATDPAPTASPSTGSPAAMPSAPPSGTGSTQQYYQNGAAFAKDNEGTLAANTEGAVTDAGVSACSAVASSSPGAGMAGDEDTDTGPTAADQAAWISGCAANYTGTGTSTDPTTAPTPTATGSPNS